VLSIPIPFAGIVDLEEEEKKEGKKKDCVASIHPSSVSNSKARKREREREGTY
jgi:hypothetical protein